MRRMTIAQRLKSNPRRSNLESVNGYPARTESFQWSFLIISHQNSVSWTHSPWIDLQLDLKNVAQIHLQDPQPRKYIASPIEMFTCSNGSDTVV